MKLFATFIIIAIGTCIAFITDYSMASPEWVGGVVTDKIYEPQTVSVSTDSKGNFTTTCNGPYYYIVARAGEKHGRISVSPSEYDQWQRDEEGMVQFRTGKLTRYGFLSIQKP